MQQLVFVKPGVLGWQEAPTPRLQGRGEALVRPLAVAACDLDVAFVQGRAPLPRPFPLGHEFVAEITDLSDDVVGWQPGERVIVPFRFVVASVTAVEIRQLFELEDFGLSEVIDRARELEKDLAKKK